MIFEDFVNRAEFASYEEFYKDFKLRVPADFNFAFDVMDALASRKPKDPAMIWCDDKGGEATFSYQDIKDQSNKAANFFIAQGIRKGDKVMLVLKRRFEFWFCHLALHKIGAVSIPATHLLTTKDIVYRNNAADIKMIVSVNEPEVIAHIDEAKAKSPTLKITASIQGAKEGWIDFSAQTAKMSPVFERPVGVAATRNDDMMLLYFTSGTTGMPKMVAHNFTYPLGHIVTARYWQCVRPGKPHLTVADTGWAKAMWGKIYGQWLSEAVVFVYDMEKFVPKTLLETLEKYRVATFCAPPTIYRFLIKEDLGKYDLKALEYCAIAGEPLNPEVYQQFLNLTGLELKEGFGQTECTVTLANYPWMKTKPGSMGKPTPGYEVLLLKDDLTPCVVGDEGQVAFRTEGGKKPVGMFEGYYRDQALTDRVWHDGFYFTGDIAWMDEDGYYWFVGRADDVIKSSGYRIGPFEVESALLEHPAVMECAVTAAPDPDRGQVVKATIILTKKYQPSPELAKELQEHVKKVTAPYKYPRIIEFSSELPKTISGKIRRVEIRDKDGT
jgi:acetyl-CoA synthetase